MLTTDQLALVVIILAYVVWSSVRLNRLEHMVDIKPIEGEVNYKRNKCKYKMSDTTKAILDENDIKNTKSSPALILPCSYNKINKEIKSIKLKNPEQRIFIIHGADQLTGKNSIWSNLVESYGRIEAARLMPKTYVLSNTIDILHLHNEFVPTKLYILKKNVQRQEGLKITRSKNDILTAAKDGFVIAQELLQDPYTINSRKINMRFYLLIVCQNGEVNAYVHRDGFMYYTKTEFEEDSIDIDPNITTGYIDRQVYEENPLTHEDFRRYLDEHNRMLSDIELTYVGEHRTISDLVFGNIYYMLKKVVNGVKHNLCKEGPNEQITFQLFGADVALNKDLEPMLMEINKGPDMGAKDERDYAVKHGVMEDTFKVVKLINSDRHRFIQIV